MFIYLFWERERERKRKSASRGGAERAGERESQAGSTLSAQSPMRGLIPQFHKITTWTEESDTQLIEPPRQPIYQKCNLLIKNLTN